MQEKKIATPVMLLAHRWVHVYFEEIILIVQLRYVCFANYSTKFHNINNLYFCLWESVLRKC